MLRRLRAAAMAAAAMLHAVFFATAAMAGGDAPITSLPLTAGGVTYQECTWNDGASTSHFTICTLMKGWDYTNQTTHSWSVDANGLGHVSLDLLNSTAFPYGLPVAQADQQNTVTGFNIGTVGNNSAIPLTNGRGAVGLSTSGITGSGATLQVQAQNYPSGPWAGVACILPQTGQNLASFSSDVTCRVNAAGHDSLRLVVLTASTSSSATMSYGYTATVGDGVVTEINSSQIAANTAPGATRTVYQGGTTGTDYSSNVGALPNIGAAFSSSSVSCPSYVLLKTIPASASRANVDVENQSGAQVCVVRDDGTAASGAIPSNGSLVVLGGGTASGKQGGSYTSTTFKGRLQVYAASASAQVSAFTE